MNTPTPPPLPGDRPSSLSQTPKTEFTRTGGFLIILTIIFTLAFGLFLPFWLFPRILPAGTRYPSFLIAIPIIVFGALFFIGAAWVAGKFGFPASKPKESNSDDNHHNNTKMDHGN